MICQRNWLYLESIFSAPDIPRQLPAEAKMFMTVDRSYKDIMRKVNKMPTAIRAGTQSGEKMTQRARLGDLQRKKKFQKSEITMEVGGWVQVSLGILFGFLKSSQNCPKPVLIFRSSIPCVFCLYIHC